MTRPTYRGHTADDLTGPAAGLYSAMRTMGVSEAGALREAVDTHMPADRFDNEVRVLQLMNGLTEAQATTSVASRYGGTVAEARRTLTEDDQPTDSPAAPLSTTTQVTETDPPAGSDHDGTHAEFVRRVEAAEARGLTFDQALTEATRWRNEQREAGRARLTETTAPAAGSSPPISSATPPAAPPTDDRQQLRETNETRALSIFTSIPDDEDA